VTSAKMIEYRLTLPVLTCRMACVDSHVDSR
jgi:hypothetical protein